MWFLWMGFRMLRNSLLCKICFYPTDIECKTFSLIKHHSASDSILSICFGIVFKCYFFKQTTIKLYRQGSSN